MVADFNPNVVTGLASGLDTKSIIEKLVAAERKKIEPVENRKQEKQLELDSWKQVKSYIENVKSAATVIAQKSIWDGKSITSSDPEIVEAIATSGAEAGKHTLIVDKLALNHQIASQGFAAKDDQIGQGTVFVSIGDDPEQKLVIDESNNTLQGYADTFNAMDLGVNANIIKTGNQERPFQIVLTSQKTGHVGEIKIRSEVTGEGVLPSFDPYYIQPGRWKTASGDDRELRKPTGLGASTSVAQLVGEYTGDEPIELTFTVVNTGIVGSTEKLQMRWDDDQGRFGYLDIGSFKYTPGTPIEVVDGISLILSDEELVVNDYFTASAKNQESALFWWKSDEERLPSIKQPSPWFKQHSEGIPVVSGKYNSEDDDFFTLKVVGGGQIGEAEGLRIDYESEQGVSGSLLIGAGYDPGQKLSLANGLDMSFKPGILRDGDILTFEYQEESTLDYWWLEDKDRVEAGSIINMTDWKPPEELSFSIPGKSSPRLSTAAKSIVGNYTDFEPKTYTFTVRKDGGVGVTQGVTIDWNDDKDNSGTINVGAGYSPGDPLEFDSGLSLVMEKGNIFEGDFFEFKTFTPTIQPPQDAEIRFGATSMGGGLLITNPTNLFDEVIKGVKLNLLDTSEKVITITIEDDIEKALEGIKTFVEKYNEMLLFFKEITKYDQDTNEAAALQGDRNLPRIQAETNRIFIDSITGLKNDRNLLLNLGLRLNIDGLIEMDVEKLTNILEQDISKVANLFRSYGQIDNSGISYLSSTKNTKISGNKGFDVDVIAAATSGYYETPVHQGLIEINEDNKNIKIIVNGRDSEEIMLETGSLSAEQIAKDIQNKINDDKYLGKMKVAVTTENGKIRISSGRVGTGSTVNITALNENLNSHPLTNGNAVSGTNVQGSIDGTPMEGNGRILTGKDGTDYEGLKLYVELSENQINEGKEGNMVFTKGVATKILEYIENIMAKKTGSLEIYTNSVQEQLGAFTKEVETLESRIDVKRKKLMTKFAKLESKMGELKSQQNYMSKQLAKI